MKVLFQSRVDLFDKPGGDTTQILETKKSLENLGVVVDIDNSLKKNLKDYDLVHVFNLDWVCEAYYYVKNAKRQNKKVILSPIHHNLQEFMRYEKEYRWGLAKVGNIIVPIQSLRDSARNLLKGLKDRRKLRPAIFQFIFGIRREQRKAIELSDYVLVQTNREAQDLQKAYKPGNKFNWQKVVNGVNIEKFSNPNFEESKKVANFTNYILAVGRVEPRKNQISLIKAFNNLSNSLTDYHLVFCGSKNNHHPTYIKAFEKLVNSSSNIHYLGFMDQSVLAGIYAKANVFAVPSWFETTGLVYLEAVVAGCKSVVASGDRAYEYLENNGVYCDPGSISSIEQALLKATQNKTVNNDFRQKVIKEYNWDNTANQTLQIYKKVLGD